MRVARALLVLALASGPAGAGPAARVAHAQAEAPPSEALPSPRRHVYTSLSGGDVVMHFDADPGGRDTYFESGTADQWSLHECGPDSGLVCLDNERMHVAVPQDFAERVAGAGICDAVAWKHQGASFSLTVDRHHGIRACSEALAPFDYLLAGHRVTAYQIGVHIDGCTDRNSCWSSFLWSPTHGLLAFSDVAGADFWSQSPCGYGAPAACGQKP